MLKKALTAGATVVVALLVSAGAAQASVGEVHASHAVPFTAPAQAEDPEETTAPDPEDESESTDSEATDSESTGSESTDSGSTDSGSTDSESTTEPEQSPEEETEPVDPAPAPEGPAAGLLGLIESAVASLFG